MQSSASPPAKKLTLIKLPAELKDKIYGFVLPSGKIVKRIKTSECVKISAWNTVHVVRCDNAVLQVSKMISKEAADVLLARNTVVLNVEECCSTHGDKAIHALSRRQFHLKHPYRRIQLQLRQPRSSCTVHCVLDLIKSIAAVLKATGIHKLTVDMGVRYAGVGTVTTTISPVTVHFVHPALAEAWSIMARLPRGLAKWPVQYEHPHRLWGIDVRYPRVVRRLAAFLKEYYDGQDGEDGEGAYEVWTDHVASEEELETVTHCALTEADGDDQD
ncbi:hypothetical protein LTR57_010300 [Friedmanniomyces endolithicus]|uniref:Uncharacterized protein n=1 Tax=Friedmanniomyces endolithicus TaxID=329885 RepID=A0AAN6FHA7_9PEZI|nr:hypothetical protein LTR35_015102 [Friedmanniomyces endolithicus]KAK0317219.1 hypothetical protein LTR82_011820 [Friedmanniomyces endolithicus]KAK0919862.1 hypothetical protein LTR57_010300 [Friedmanniomyces endolithicus]KAK0971030.1 hypothetical protein LTS01_015490 [Friedmanniomyces endolithicus]